MRSTNIDIHPRPARRAGFTLLEMLLSVVLTLVLMYLVAEVFSVVGSSINDSRALLGLSDRLRATQSRLEMDLKGITSCMTPPAKIGDNEGYFELIEGPVGPTVSITTRAMNIDEAGNPVPDTTAIDYDDVLMFTTCTTNNEPFMGRAIRVKVSYDSSDIPTGNTLFAGDRIESRFAEVAWFVRGRTLYRRVKIIKPDFVLNAGGAGPPPPHPLDLTCFSLYGGTTMDPSTLSDGVLGGLGGTLLGYEDQDDSLNNVPIKIIKDLNNPVDAAFENIFDLSTHIEVDTGSPLNWTWVPNSLADLTKRENRMYHAPAHAVGQFVFRFPFMSQNTQAWQVLGLPTLGETSNLNWMISQWNAYGAINGPELPDISLTQDTIPDLNDLAPVPTTGQLDFWNEPFPYSELNPITGNLTAYEGPRAGEDVILNNVIGFDVKVWDPDAPVISIGTTVLKPGDSGYRTVYAAGGWTLVSNGAFVDLGYGTTVPFPGIHTSFSDNPNPKSGFTTGTFVYDTWSTHYEHDGIDQNMSIDPNFEDAGYNGLDDDGDGLVDDVIDIDFDGSGSIDLGVGTNELSELDTLPPYPVQLEAIQIKIRVFEPDSRKVREVTIVHRFSKK